MRTSPPRRLGFLLSATLLLATGAHRSARVDADDRLPGEVAELTDKTRADAQVQLDVILKGTGDVGKARRALLLMGPAIWPAVDNALRLTPSDAARPHLTFLKALLLKKAEPEFEALRGRLRRKLLTDDMNGIGAELNEFRLGMKDPANPGKRLPLKVPATKLGSTTTYRSADQTLVVAFGGDATAKKPDAPEVSLTDPAAGFAAAVGGKPLPYDRQSGKGADASCEAPQGFAYAWPTDGAVGKAPGGTGGESGVANVARGRRAVGAHGGGRRRGPGQVGRSLATEAVAGRPSRPPRPLDPSARPACARPRPASQPSDRSRSRWPSASGRRAPPAPASRRRLRPPTRRSRPRSSSPRRIAPSSSRRSPSRRRTPIRTCRRASGSSSRTCPTRAT